jgi:Fe-S-cluster containining protein
MNKSREERILNLLHRGFPDNRINCFRCGVGCRYGVSMGAEDAELIGNNIGKPVQAFLIGYSHDSWMGSDEDTWLTNSCIDFDWIDELDNYRTKRNDGGCVFLQKLPETNEVCCSIHTVRPPACRGYAPELDREACATRN